MKQNVQTKYFLLNIDLVATQKKILSCRFWPVWLIIKFRKTRLDFDVQLEPRGGRI